MAHGLAERIRIIEGDITKLEVEAIVTAANEALVGGHGVDGAVHRAAGPGLFEECRSLGYCPEGQARITKGYLLPAKYIIHTVGPVWEGGGFGEAELLASCYRESLGLAESRGLKTLGFPCIATGAHEYPPEQAAEVALAAITEWLNAHHLPQEVVICCFNPEDTETYRNLLVQRGLSSSA